MSVHVHVDTSYMYYNVQVEFITLSFLAGGTSDRKLDGMLTSKASSYKNTLARVPNTLRTTPVLPARLESYHNNNNKNT